MSQRSDSSVLTPFLAKLSDVIISSFQFTTSVANITVIPWLKLVTDDELLENIECQVTKLLICKYMFNQYLIFWFHIYNINTVPEHFFHKHFIEDKISSISLISSSGCSCRLWILVCHLVPCSEPADFWVLFRILVPFLS